jgi:uncharacterized repeat protein (TIGR03803 family)
MRGKRRSIALRVTLAIFAVTLFVAGADATTEKVLYSFNNSKSGFGPQASLISDQSGNLYGTAPVGGVYQAGTAFELMPKAGGGWTENVLHNFGKGSDGKNSYAGLIFDSAGNIYGTASGGGVYKVGTAFELMPKAGGGWTEKVLHNFGKGSDGTAPYSSLIFDSAGNLYGTTISGGDLSCNTGFGCGTVFELTPKAGGGWTEKILHKFNGKNGSQPSGSLIFDAAGTNLYGATVFGGPSNSGIVFELTPKAGGGWTEKVLHKFPPNFGRDGYNPTGSLTFDASGNLYGTTFVGGHGGRANSGTVFRMTPQADGSWTETVLHNFTQNADGYTPFGGLIFDGVGNLYGTTFSGGSNGTEKGTVFKLAPQAGGTWTESLLYSFCSLTNCRDGAKPVAGLIFDADGNLYGTTLQGGTSGTGTVFEITP